jgi:hypothetical protein
MAKVTEQTVTQSNIPKWAEPYATRLLGEAESLTYTQPYRQYEGQRIAGFNPLQQQAFAETQGLGPSSQLGQASGLAGLVGRRAGQMGSSYQPMQYQPVGVSYMGTQAPSLQQFQMDPAQQIGAERFGGAQAAEYMSPYMTGVVEQQKQAAVQDYSRQIPGLQAAGIRSGARGGTREALLQAEAQRGLQQQLGGIEATGRQQAFQQAQQQFGADRAAQMQAALANQQAGLTTGGQNLQALLGIQQLGAQTGLQSQQLNQAAQLQAQQQAIAQNQAAQQAMEQSRQFGAGYGMQGLQQQLAAAQALGGFGQAQFGQQQAAIQGRQAAGSQLQQLEQQRLEQQYQDFLGQQRYPYTQLGFMSDMLRGVPSSSSTVQNYQAPPSALGQIANTGIGLAGLYGAFKQP